MDPIIYGYIAGSVGGFICGINFKTWWGMVGLIMVSIAGHYVGAGSCLS